MFPMIAYNVLHLSILCYYPNGFIFCPHGGDACCKTARAAYSQRADSPHKSLATAAGTCTLASVTAPIFAVSPALALATCRTSIRATIIRATHWHFACGLDYCRTACQQHCPEDGQYTLCRVLEELTTWLDFFFLIFLILFHNYVFYKTLQINRINRQQHIMSCPLPVYISTNREQSLQCNGLLHSHTTIIAA